MFCSMAWATRSIALARCLRNTLPLVGSGANRAAASILMSEGKLHMSDSATHYWLPKMKEKLDITLNSDYPPQLCLAKLAEHIDMDQFTLFSFSGYDGDKPILGRIAGNEFRLHKRRYWRNAFAPVLFGRVLPDSKGTAIEAYW